MQHHKEKVILIQPLLRKDNSKKPYYFPLIPYNQNLIFLLLIMEVCNVLLKKSNTECTCKKQMQHHKGNVFFFLFKCYINSTLIKKRQ